MAAPTAADSARLRAATMVAFIAEMLATCGLRGPDLTADDLRKRVVLCLGDSITYGYGVGDDATYAAQLQALLDRTHPGQFTVLNGGVSAYPMAFVRQKFLYLWEQGIHPEFVVIGYSMNEGFLGHLVDSDDATKDADVLAVPASWQPGQWAGLVALLAFAWWMHAVATRQGKR